MELNTGRPDTNLFSIIKAEPVDPFSVVKPDSEDISKSVKSFKDATASIKSTLNHRKARILRELAQVEYNLEHFDEMYQDSTPRYVKLMEPAVYEELVAGIEKLKNEPGRFTVLDLTIYNTYHDMKKLFVAEVPSYQALNENLSYNDCVLVLKAMRDAGVEISTFWNGQGHTSMSIRTMTFRKSLEAPAQEIVSNPPEDRLVKLERYLTSI